MGIFNLSNKKETPKVEDTKEIVKPEDTIELNKEVEDKEKPINLDSNNNNEITKPKDKVIVLDGPLSNIYTKALNEVYSKKLNNPDDPNIKESLEGMQFGGYKFKAPDNDEHSTMYVYCLDSDELSTKDVDEAIGKVRIALDSKKSDKAMVVAEEHGGVVSNTLVLLDQLCSSMGIKMYTNRRTALEAILVS